MIAILTKIFNYLQSTGVLAAGIAFILAVWKAALPLAQAHVKTAQQKSLLTAIEGLVALNAQVAALSKQDRFNAVLNGALTFASDRGYTWAKSGLVKGLIENIYQEYKRSGKDVAPVITTPSSDVVEDKPESDVRDPIVLCHVSITFDDPDRLVATASLPSYFWVKEKHLTI